MTNLASAAPDRDALAAFDLDPCDLEPAPAGLINTTWFVRTRGGERLVLQRLHSIFPPEINDDVAVVTAHLAKQGAPTPRLVPAAGGRRWFLDDAGGVWRALTYVDGTTRAALQSPPQAREAGRVLAQFHRAVSTLDHQFKNARLGVHDTPRHLRALRQALEECAGHREFSSVEPLAARVLELAASLPALPAADDRIVHGDPKISNIVFERGTDRAICLIDLDTLARMPIALELGDAFRSWCNPVAEDAKTAGFSLPLFAAAIEGYAEAARGFLTSAEWGAIPAATLSITVELAARFCTDALREEYFGWDRTRYASASAHNLARTRNQLTVAGDVRAALNDMHPIVNRAFGRSNGP